ncbi:hypothetical protein [Adlercreutzia sp.]|uniref:hypothetical protein n=1 Tax=Adlercreutzia sp. TaxID=1872387 RepID=UPI003FD74933
MPCFQSLLVEKSLLMVSYNFRMNEKQSATRYDGVLPSHMALDIWEIYARLVLQHIDSATYGGLLHGDKPDLFDNYRELGVEVTQAISTEGQEAGSLYTRLNETEDEAERSRLVERIEQLGAKVCDHVLFGPNGKDSFDLILSIFKNKLAKINNGGYRQFAHNHLFIRSDILAGEEMLGSALLQFANLNESPQSFERGIVSVPGHNYDFDLLATSYHDLPFSSNDQYEMAEKARTLAIEADSNHAAK